MEEGGRARVGRLVSFSFVIGRDGGADLGEGGCEVVRGVDEGVAGVTDGDADELDSSAIFSKGGEQGEVFVGLLCEFLMAAEVPAKADFDEDEGEVLRVKGVDAWGRVGRHSSCVDDVGGSSCSCRH